MKSNYRKNAGRFGEIDDTDVGECQPPPLPRSRWSTAFPNARGVLEEDNSMCQPVSYEHHPISTLCATYLFSDDMSSLGGSEHNRTFSTLPEVLTPPTVPADVVDVSTSFQEVELPPCLLPTPHRAVSVSPIKNDSRPRSSRKEETRASSKSDEKDKRKKSKKHRSKKEEASNSTMESSSRSSDRVRRKREHRQSPSKERRSRREGSTSKEHRSRRASASCTSRSKDRSSSSSTQVKPLRRIRSKSHRAPSRKSQKPVDPQEILEVVTRSERATRSIDMMIPDQVISTPRQSPVDKKLMAAGSDVSPCSPTSAETEFSEFGESIGKGAIRSSRTPNRRANPVVSHSRMTDLIPKVWGKRNLT